MAGRADSTGDLGKINVPTLVITSSEDALIAGAITSLMAPAIRDARLEVIEGAGHLSNLESPQRFNELLREQLTLLS
jgi:pimeloyl-ACP methyl ester carboxylesterase